MSAGLYTHTTRAFGTILTAQIYNDDHQNHISNHNPLKMGGYSDSVAEMQSSVSPGGIGTESLAASLSGELQRIRFVINRIVGGSQWYEAPIRDLSTPFADANGTFDSNTGADQTPAVKVSGGVNFNLDWDDLLGQQAEFSIGRTTITGQIRFAIYKPNTTDIAFRVTTAASGGSNVGGEVLATKEQAEAGAADNKLMTPLRTVEYVSARIALKVDAEAGTDNLLLMTPFRTKQAIDHFVSHFDSGDLAWSQNSSGEVSHNLGGQPDIFQWSLRCITTEGGYSPGDEIHSDRGRASSSQSGIAVMVSATKIRFSLGLVNTIVTKSGTGYFDPSPANWRMRLKAIKFN